MGRKRKHVNYRQLYKVYFGIDFGPEMAVHHIDFNRDNNDINNLLLMPRALHAKYHMHISQLGGAGNGMINPDMRANGNIYRDIAVKGIAEALEKIDEWVQIKGTMLRMKDSGVRWSDYVRSQVD